MIEKLQDEMHRGTQAEFAYEHFLKDFFEQKRQILFEAFQNAPYEDVETLKELKRMSTALDALETEINTIIDTGRMAAKQLENQEKH